MIVEVEIFRAKFMQRACFLHNRFWMHFDLKKKIISKDKNVRCALESI